jgi:hypothetical protein
MLIGALPQEHEQRAPQQVGCVLLLKPAVHWCLTVRQQFSKHGSRTTFDARQLRTSGEAAGSQTAAATCQQWPDTSAFAPAASICLVDDKTDLSKARSSGNEVEKAPTDQIRRVST